MLASVRATAKLTGLKVRVIRHDILPRCGPLGGIYTALKTSRTNGILFLACDMPLVSAGLLRWLLDSADASTRPVPTFVSAARSIGFPFVVPRAALPIVRKQIQRDQLSLHQLARALKAGIIRPPRDWALQVINLNTPEEFRAATGVACKRIPRGLPSRTRCEPGTARGPIVAR